MLLLGAGSIVESLELKKPLVVVINDQLMHNHQIELAKQLQADNHLLFTTCRLANLIDFYNSPLYALSLSHTANFCTL